MSNVKTKEAKKQVHMCFTEDEYKKLCEKANERGGNHTVYIKEQIFSDISNIYYTKKFKNIFYQMNDSFTQLRSSIREDDLKTAEKNLNEMEREMKVLWQFLR